MLKFKFLLWMLEKLLRRAIHKHSDAAAHVAGRDVTFQIRTLSGIGRTYRVCNGGISSKPGIAADAGFTLLFTDAASGFRILSAKDSQDAFLQGLHDGELVVSGDFVQVVWFQRLTDFLQPEKPKP